MKKEFIENVISPICLGTGYSIVYVSVIYCLITNTPKLSALKQWFVISCDSGVDWSDLVIHMVLAGVTYVAAFSGESGGVPQFSCHPVHEVSSTRASPCDLSPELPGLLHSMASGFHGGIFQEDNSQCEKKLVWVCFSLFANTPLNKASHVDKPVELMWVLGGVTYG